MKNNMSPCVYCTKVTNPENCENKSCIPWREWFLERWELIRAFPRYHMETAPLREPGICLGGRMYAHPEAVRKYLQRDPCKQCPCPKDLCTAPCPTRLAWESRRKEIAS